MKIILCCNTQCKQSLFLCAVSSTSFAPRVAITLVSQKPLNCNCNILHIVTEHSGYLVTFKLNLLIQYFDHFVAVVTFNSLLVCLFFVWMFVNLFSYSFTHTFPCSLIHHSNLYIHSLISNICSVLPFNTCNWLKFNRK